jgi:hypothetical protein
MRNQVLGSTLCFAIMMALPACGPEEAVDAASGRLAALDHVPAMNPGVAVLPGDLPPGVFPAPERVGRVIGPEGGVIKLGPLTISIPSGAVSDRRMITLTATHEKPPAGMLAGSAIYRLEPQDLFFQEPVTLRLAGASDRHRTTFYRAREDGGGYEPVATWVEGKLAWTRLSHFSEGFFGGYGVRLSPHAPAVLVVDRLRIHFPIGAVDSVVDVTASVSDWDGLLTDAGASLAVGPLQDRLTSFIDLRPHDLKLGRPIKVVAILGDGLPPQNNLLARAGDDGIWHQDRASQQYGDELSGRLGALGYVVAIHECVPPVTQLGSENKDDTTSYTCVTPEDDGTGTRTPYALPPAIPTYYQRELYCHGRSYWYNAHVGIDVGPAEASYRNTCFTWSVDDAAPVLMGSCTDTLGISGCDASDDPVSWHDSNVCNAEEQDCQPASGRSCIARLAETCGW